MSFGSLIVENGARHGDSAFVTIVSANYLAAARVLCRSLEEHHPDVRRYVVLVDRPMGADAAKAEPFEVVGVEQLGIPDLEDFLAQYTVMEANTAVKPYALSYLLETRGIDRLVYLDPDIWVHAPLDAVFRALQHASVVLTPHMRDPFRDDETPREEDILRAGTYNLGFIGLKRGPSAQKLLTWWAEKTAHDCVVDWARAMFVDQKWIDLVPGYIADVEVLHEPEYNVGYWNLHDRQLVERDGCYFADDRPLAFFHFSGYNPDRPYTLSKHQSRHDLRSQPVLKRICDEYSERLQAEGHERARRTPYGYSRLANGIPVSSGIREVVRRLRKAKVRYPSVRDADAFCRFLMTPNAEVSGAEIAPLAAWILDSRPDVARAFPEARRRADDQGFLHWLDGSAHECESEEICRRFKTHLTWVNPFTRVRRIYDAREDLREAYPDAFRTLEGLDLLAGWLTRYGIKEEDVAPEDIAAFVTSGRTGFENVLDLYFSSPELQEQYPLALLPCGTDFIEWLVRDGAGSSNLSLAECLWFECRVREANPSELLLLTALRTSWASLRFPLGATPFGWSELCTWARGQAQARGYELTGLAARPPDRLSGVLALELLHATGAYSRMYPHAMASRAGLRQLADAALQSQGAALRLEERAALDHAIGSYTPVRGVNVAGHFHYAGGVGSAARALTSALDAADIPHEDLTLPVAPSKMRGAGAIKDGLPDRFWKLHRPDFDTAITVANADTMRAARSYLGPGYGSHRKHIAYWVWETDTLPGKYAAAAEGLDAIWTPSEFSARGIRKTLGGGLPVEVLPYAVALHAPADPRKHPVALPAKKTLFGCFFDARSIVERKNPAALLRAFRRAFRKDDPVTLVLKVSHGSAAPAEMQELERLADGLPVMWLRDMRLDDFQMRSLLARLDVYVSLHRSEGFGLALAEAMAVRTAVVATGFSGNMEFMDADCARLVNFREMITDRSYGPYPRGTRWADPDVEHAAEILRELHLGPALRRELGERGRQRIESELAPWVIAETAKRLLGWGGGEPRGPRELHSVTGGRDSTTGRPHAAARAPAVFTARALPGE